MTWCRLSDQIPQPIEIEDEHSISIADNDDEEQEMKNHINKINICNAEIEESKHEVEEIFDDYEVSDIDAKNELQDLMSKSTGDWTVKSFTIRWSWNKLNAFINQTYGSNRNSDWLNENSPNCPRIQVTALNNGK